MGYKHPNRAKQYELSYGKAYVFDPEVSNEQIAAVLALDIDSIYLDRGEFGSKEGNLFDYLMTGYSYKFTIAVLHIENIV